MMKKIFIAIMALLMTASASYAADLELSGKMNVQGSYYNNFGLDADDTYAFSAYDQDFNLTAKFVVSEETTITTRFAIHDEVWADQRPTLNKIVAVMDVLADGNDPENILALMADQEADDDFTCERVYMTHKFPADTTLDLGLMTGGEFASSFHNDARGAYRVKVTKMTPIGAVLGVLEKNAEVGFVGPTTKPDGISANMDTETDDFDAYYGILATKAGPANVKVLLAYVPNGLAYEGATGFVAGFNGEVDQTTMGIDIGADAVLEDLNIGFETELIFKSVSHSDDMGSLYGPGVDGSDLDHTLMGFYLNGWYNLEPAKIGLWLAYGSSQDIEIGGVVVDRKNFDFDDDFDSTNILGDELGVGGGDDLTGCTAVQLYADVNVPSVEKLTISPSFTYVMSNVTDDDATAMEIDIDGSYKVTDTFSYSAAIAYATISLGIDGQDDPSAVMKLSHKFEIVF